MVCRSSAVACVRCPEGGAVLQAPVPLLLYLQRHRSASVARRAPTPACVPPVARRRRGERPHFPTHNGAACWRIVNFRTLFECSTEAFDAEDEDDDAEPEQRGCVREEMLDVGAFEEDAADDF